jgi:hypothetical protein
VILNSKQRAIILVGLAIIAIMSLFPPWIFVFKTQYVLSEKPSDYYFIANPPSTPDFDARIGYRIDTTRLAVQWVTIIVAVGFGLILTAKKQDS